MRWIYEEYPASKTYRAEKLDIRRDCAQLTM